MNWISLHTSHPATQDSRSTLCPDLRRTNEAYWVAGEGEPETITHVTFYAENATSVIRFNRLSIPLAIAPEDNVQLSMIVGDHENQGGDATPAENMVRADCGRVVPDAAVTYGVHVSDSRGVVQVDADTMGVGTAGHLWFRVGGTMSDVFAPGEWRHASRECP